MGQKSSRETIPVNWVLILRGILALGLFFYHFGGTSVTLTAGPLVHTFRLWVNHGPEIAAMFFVLSGFLVTLPLAGTPQSLRSVMTFWGKRLGKLVPAYWLVTLAGIFILREYALPNFSEHILRACTFTLNDFAVLSREGSQYWFAHINAPMWFMSVLIQLYLLAPVLMGIRSALEKHRIVLFFPFTLIGIALRVWIYTHHQPWQPEYAFVHMQLPLAGSFLLFGAGMDLAWIFRRLKYPRNYWLPWAGAASILAWWMASDYLYVNAASVQRELLFLMPVITIVTAAVFLYSVLGSTTVRRSWFSAVALGVGTFFGSLSFHIYMWHWLVINYVWSFTRFPPQFNNYQSVLAACLGGTLVLSMASKRVTDLIAGRNYRSPKTAKPSEA